MKKPVITFDCDGVFANFTLMFNALVNDKFGTSYHHDWPQYNPVPGFFEQKHWDEGFALVRSTPYFWMLLEAYEGIPFKKIGAMLTDGVFTGYVVSQRSSADSDVDAGHQTRMWLNDKGLTDLQGVIVGYQDRPVLLTLLGADAHLDDSGAHVLKCRAAGVNAYLLDRTWNQDCDLSPEFRVKSIDEFLDRVVAPFLPEDAIKTYFSPPAATDIVQAPNPFSSAQIACWIKETGFQFNQLPELVRQ